MKTRSIKTKIFNQKENIVDFILESTETFSLENKVLAVTSKIVSLSEGRVLTCSPDSKIELIKKESDHYLGEIGYGCHLTIKHNLFIPSAGIDSSNSKTGECILFPEKPFDSAKNIYEKIKTKRGLKNFGVIITDSRTSPMRQGVTGVALSYWGFQGVQDKRGEDDLFGRKLLITQVNLADALAVTAVLTMGEGSEGRPLALISDIPIIQFTDKINPLETLIDVESDLYAPIYKNLIK